MTLKKIPVPIYKYTNGWSNRVKRVQIKKETEHFVIDMDGNRHKKETVGSSYSVAVIWTDTAEEMIEHIREGLATLVNRRKVYHDKALEEQQVFEDRVKEFYKKE